MSKKINQAKRLEVMLSYACTNKCNFCLEWNNRKKQRFNKQPFPLDVLIKFFRKNQQKYESIFITGGEPTLYPYFFDIVSIAKDCNFEIHLSTNGAFFSSSMFALKALPFIDEIILSIHGHNGRLHDGHTNSLGSFRGATKGLRNILNLKPDINLLTNTVVTKINFQYLPDIIEYLYSFGVKRMLFSNMVPVNIGNDFVLSKMVRLNDWRGKIYTIFKLADSLGIDIKIFGIPLCIISDFADSKDDFGRETEEIYDRIEFKGGSMSMTAIDRSTPIAAKSKACRQCKKKNSCKGFFKPYYEIYGDSELEPFR